MKKSNSFLLVAILLFSTAFLDSYAQVAMSSLRGSSADKALPSAKSYEGTSGVTNLRAVKSFNRDYRDAVEAEWSTLSDKSLVCWFLRNNIRCRAFYTAHRQWTATVSGYDAARLDKGIY